MITVWGKRTGTKQYMRSKFMPKDQALDSYNLKVDGFTVAGYKPAPPEHTQLAEAFQWLLKQPLTGITPDVASVIGSAPVKPKKKGPAITGLPVKPEAEAPEATPFEPDCLGCMISRAVKGTCARCGGRTDAHSFFHPHASLQSDCAGWMDQPVDKPTPDKVLIDSSPVAHQDCKCGHCMSAHGQVDDAVRCLVITCHCEAYRFQCIECGGVSTTGGWSHTDDCVTGYRLRPERRAEEGTRRQPRRTSELIKDDL